MNFKKKIYPKNSQQLRNNLAYAIKTKTFNEYKHFCRSAWIFVIHDLLDDHEALL